MGNLIDDLRTYLNSAGVLSAESSAQRAARNLRALVAAFDALAPAWSSAPEWAMWYAIDACGDRLYFEAEPYPQDESGEWRFDEARLQRATVDIGSELVGQELIPLDIDWRRCLWQRSGAA